MMVQGVINKKMMTISLNINGQNTLIKRQRLSGCIKKQNLTMWCLQELHSKYKEIIDWK